MMQKLTKACAFALIGLGLVFVAPDSPSHAEGTMALQPASPQPAAEDLKPGLGVVYAFQDIRWLRDVASWIDSKGKPGDPLENLGYYSDEGENALTTHRSELVLAKIDGYINFPKAGQYQLEFASNDGLAVSIGGVEVYRHDGRHVCDTLGPVSVSAPEAGWYQIDITYFQRAKSSCLWLSWGPPGAAVEEDAVAPEYFAH